MDRVTSRGDYFTRDRHNQSLDYLRLRNSDVLDRVARGGSYRDLFNDSRRYRVRPIHHVHHVNIRHRYRLPFNVRSPRYYRVANRMVWWRGVHLGGYRYDPMRHFYRNYRGHVIGVYYWNLFRPHYRFIVPHYNQYYRGSYFCDGGNYYYYPDTYVSPEAYSSGLVSESPPERVQMQYGAFAHTTDLAYRFERLMNDLCLDMHYNYQQNPEFDEVYREAYDLLNIAKDILASAEQGDLGDVAEQLFGLDQLYYHLLDQIADWNRTEQKPIGEHDLLTKLSLVEATMQHLMYDSGVEPSFEVVDDSVPEDPEPAGVGAPMIQFPQLP